MSPPSTAEAQEEQQGAGPGAIGQVDPSTIEKVNDFLRQIRGLNNFSGPQLESLLYECRFDLLPPGATTDPRGKTRVLPFFDQVPTQTELHDLLLGGHVPHGHQRVAHVLYPESVAWPGEEAGEANPGAAEPEEEDERVGVVLTGVRQYHSASPASSDVTRRGTSMRASQKSLVSNSMQENAAPDVEGWSSDFARRSRHGLGVSAAQLMNVADGGEGAAEVTVRGQRVRSTVRGHPVQDIDDDLSKGDRAVDEEAYKVARERRVKCERAAKLEQFHERKLGDRIAYLEQLRAAELEHRAAVEKREALRLARQEELKQLRQEGFERKLEQERVNAEKDAEKKAKEAEAEQRWKKHHAKQKEQVVDWIVQKSDDYLSREAQARMKQAELAAQKRVKVKEKEQQRKTTKQLEVLEKVHRITTAAEERPPLPPRPHDLPRPVLEVAEKADSSAERTPRTARGRGVTTWTSEAKVFSSTYGLSDRETSAVKDQLLRGVRGAGRMASYDKSS